LFKKEILAFQSWFWNMGRNLRWDVFDI